MSVIDGERDRLTRLAYRMVGSWADAEDVVQQSYERWYRLTADERAEVERPEAWFTTVASRLSLNLLNSAPARRERYVGPWLPEPIPAHAPPSPDPADRITLDHAVSMALLVALESLTPIERVAYILHEVFELPFAQIADILERTPEATRQAASSARRRLRDGRRPRNASADSHAQTVDAFHRACLGGDLGELISLLADNVVSVSDGNGATSVATRPIVGAENVARFLLGIYGQRTADTTIEAADVNGTPGFALVHENENGHRTVFGVVSFDIEDGRVHNIWFTMSPDKLTAWNAKA